MHTPRALAASSTLAIAVLSGTVWSQTSPLPRQPTPLPPSLDIKTAPHSFDTVYSAPARKQPSPNTAAVPDVPTASVTVTPKACAPRGLFYDDSTAGGGLWVRGDDFKMHFTSAGATYIPFFGSRAPRNFEIQLALRDVTVDGVPIELTGDTGPQRAKDRVSIDRGAVDELYELSPGSVEQEFVIESLPAAGEIVLRVSVDTELARSTSADGFEFSNEFGRVHCGRATAIDDDGRTLALETELDADGLTIRVPASFVAEAALPIVIDPLWYTVSLESGPAVTLQPDIAYTSGSLLFVCWEEVYSSSDHDVRCELIDDGGAVYSVFFADFTASYWARPRCAHITADDRVLVVAEVGPSGSRKVWGRAVQVAQPSSPVQTAQLEITEPGTQGETFHPDVGGDPYPYAPSYFCVVYERTFASSDHDILARLVDGNGAFPGGTIYLENSVNTLDAEPAISNTDDATIWNVAWQREVSPSNNDIFAARIHWFGGIAASTFPLPATSTNEQHPTVSGPIQGTNRYMVAWERLYAFSSVDYDIHACLIDDTSGLWNGALEFSSNNPDIQPDVESNGRHFVCSYARVGSGGAGYDVIVKDVEPVGNTCYVGEAATIGSAGDDLVPRCVNREDSDPASFSILYFVIFNHAGDIQMSAYVGLVGGSVLSVCGQSSGLPCPCGSSGTGSKGCPNSVHASGAGLDYIGSASTMNDTLTFFFDDLPPNVSCILFQSTVGSQNVFGDGVRCLAAPFVRFPIRMANGSGVTGYGVNYGDVPISVRGGVPAVGGEFFYQVWYRDSAAFCTSGTTNFTNALKVYWTP